MLLKKQYSDSYSQVAPIVKNYRDLCFSYSPHQLIMEPTRTTERTKTLIDHILTNSPEKVIQRRVIEMGLSDHELVYCSRKTSLLKLNEHHQILFRSMKSYSDEIFVDKLRSIKFPDYSNHTCMNHAYQDFNTKFLSAVDSVSPIRTLRVKSNTKPWFDIDVLNVIRNRDKHYKKFKQPAKKLIRSILNMQNFHLKSKEKCKYFL